MDWRYIIAGFCIPLNIIFIITGILISDPFAIVLGSLSTGLVLVPILRARYEKKEQIKEKVKKERNKRPLS